MEQKDGRQKVVASSEAGSCTLPGTSCKVQEGQGAQQGCIKQGSSAAALGTLARHPQATQLLSVAGAQALHTKATRQQGMFPNRIAQLTSPWSTARVKDKAGTG